MTDKQKLIRVAVTMGDVYTQTDKTLTVAQWKRRFVFDDKGNVSKVQDICQGQDPQYRTVSEAK